MTAIDIADSAELIAHFIGAGLLGYSIGFSILWFKKFVEVSH